MKKKGIWITVLICCLVAFGSTPYLSASVCTKENPEDPYPKMFYPSLEMSAPIISLANQLGPLFLEGAMDIGPMDLEELISELGDDDPDLNSILMDILAFGMFHPHDITVHMHDVDLDLTDYISITPGLGSVEVGFNLPAFNEHMDITLENGHSCGILQLWCRLENGMFALLDGMNFTIQMEEGAITMAQTAEVCVGAACNVLQPLASTVADLDKSKMNIIFVEPDDFAWLDDLDGIIGGFIAFIAQRILDFIDGFINALAVNMMEGTMEEEMMEMLVDPDTGKGLLVSMLAADVAQDGCYPPAAVQECQGAGCSTASQSAIDRSTSLVFYALPVAVMFGLLLWRRNRKG